MPDSGSEPQLPARIAGMTTPRIIVAESFRHWSAWFEGRPEIAFGGDSPGTAVDRLWAAYLQEQDHKRA
jgi:hypothetical protein